MGADLDEPGAHVAGPAGMVNYVARCIGSDERLGRSSKGPDVKNVRFERYLIVPSTSWFLDAGRARDLDFSFALNITGPGGGIWAFHASDAGWKVVEVESAATDLVLSHDLDTYIKTRYFMSDMMRLIEAGQILASDAQALTVYNQLFALPGMDLIFPRMP